MFWHISQCLLSLPLPEAQEKFISSPWSLTKLKERHLSSVGLQLPVHSQFLWPDLNARLQPMLAWAFLLWACFSGISAMNSHSVYVPDYLQFWGQHFSLGPQIEQKSLIFFKLVSVCFSGVTLSSLYVKLRTTKQLKKNELVTKEEKQEQNRPFRDL